MMLGIRQDHQSPGDSRVCDRPLRPRPLPFLALLAFDFGYINTLCSVLNPQKVPSASTWTVTTRHFWIMGWG